MKKNKSEIRSFIKKYINETGISPKISQLICDNIKSMVLYNSAKVIFAFMPTDKEVDISNVLMDILNRGKTLCIPLCLENNTMICKKITSLEDVEVGKYGILEPKKSCLTISKEKIDLAIIPCMAADEFGFRVGKGKGYYDKFLHDVKFKKAVICPQFALYSKLPKEKFDIACDVVVTENNVILCKASD